MTNEMQHFIQEAIDRIADGIRGQWTVRDEAFLKNIISDGLQPLRVEIENFEAIERERDLLKDDQATITTLRERLTAAEALFQLGYYSGHFFHNDSLVDIVQTRDKPFWTAIRQMFKGGLREEFTADTFSELAVKVYAAGWLKPQPQAETAEDQ